MTDPEAAEAEAWKRLGTWLQIQRQAAMMSRAAVTENGGPSVSTQQQLEDGGRKTRGTWVLPSPDAKTWGKLCAAAEIHPEELRHQGVVLGLWEHEDFPIAAVFRYLEATRAEQEAARASARRSAVDGAGKSAGVDAGTTPSAAVDSDLLAAVRELTQVVRELRADLREGRR